MPRVLPHEPGTSIIVLLWAAVLLTHMGCKKKLPDPDSPAPAIQDNGSPPTEAEAKEFADQMAQAIKARDAKAIDRLVRMDNLAERLISDLGLSTESRLGFLKGMNDSLQQAGMGQQILKSIEDGSYKLLRIRMVDGRPRPLFRLISEGALNYHEYTLARHKDGKVATEDIYIYISAEPLSQTIRRLIIPAVPALQAGNIDSQEFSNLKTVGTMGSDMRSGNFKAVIAAYHSLPKKSQEQKPILLIFMQATMQLGADGEADYMTAMQKFRQLYPNDAAIDFISIDYFFLKKNYVEARKSIDRVGQAVGGDPYLEVLRGNAWIEEGRFEEARRAMGKAIEKEPDLATAYWGCITLSLRERKYADTLKWLQAIVEKCHVAIANLNENPEYAEFVKSPQHDEWQRWYARNGNQKK